MTKPTLSVIVPVYKSQKFIRRCIESILNQTLSDLELILVDDGSPDNSGALCDEYAKKDKRVKVIHKQNGGAASARNAGIKIAQGEYIGFCDSDDYLHSDMYETMIKIMRENSLLTLECLANCYNTNNEIEVEEKNDRQLITKDKSQAIKDIFLRTGNVSLATRLTKASVIKEISIPEGRRVEDFYFTILLLCKTDGTAIYNYPFYNCVLSEGSVTRSFGCGIYFDAIYFYEKAIDFLRVENIDISQEQEYYILKIYYLISISYNKNEASKYKQSFKEFQKNISLKRVANNPYLLKKEKMVLFVSKLSFKITRLLFLMKNWRVKK